MRTFVEVKLALLPFAMLFALAGFGWPALAIASGIVLFALLLAWRVRNQDGKLIEVGGLLICLVLGGTYLLEPAWTSGHISALAQAGLGIVALAGVALGRPWTADYSAKAYPDVVESPIFRSVNVALSALWGALFVVLAVLNVTQTGALPRWSVVAAGVAVSVFGPRFLSRFMMGHALRSLDSYHWPVPAVGRDAPGPDLDVAIVGAGIGGLTAAALLADGGLKVAVFEQHVVPGGFCHTFLRKAHHQGQPCVYRFDAGPHDFSGVRPGGPLTSVLERLAVADRIDWKRLDHSYRFGTVALDVPRDWRDYVCELGRLFPGSASGFAALFDDIKLIFDSMFATGAGRTGIPGMPSSVDEMLAFPKAHAFAFRWMQRPFAELVGSHVTDPAAQKILGTLTGYISDGSDVLTCAQMVPLFGYFFHGGYYPVGGSGRLADVLVEAIEERGGTVRLKSAVESISVEDGRATGVVLRNGERIAAKAMISNADMKRTFQDMVGAQHLPNNFTATIEGIEPACSAFLVQLGVDFVPNINPAVHVEGDPGIGISILSKVDPTAAPAGHSTLTLIRLVPAAEARTWFSSDSDADWNRTRRSADYLARKTAMGDQMIRTAERAIPDLSRHIVHRTDASPVTFARYDWTSYGSIYGITRNSRIKGARSPLPGLFVAGSGNLGPGVEAAVIGGALTGECLFPGLLRQSSSSPHGKAGCATELGRVA